MLHQIIKEVDEIRRIRDDIVNAGKEINRTINEANKSAKQVSLQNGSPTNITEMNTNLKQLADISHNHIQGLENLDAIKGLQNFNMEGYNQAINNLKKQIVQYQKESENI